MRMKLFNITPERFEIGAGKVLQEEIKRKEDDRM